jgi:hyaluronoglucosaminidase
LSLFQDKGLEAISESEKAALRNRYAAFSHPAASEIILWLDGYWRFTQEELMAQ